jgi:hypothetical protein
VLDIGDGTSPIAAARPGAIKALNATRAQINESFADSIWIIALITTISDYRPTTSPINGSPITTKKIAPSTQLIHFLPG